VKSDTPIDPGSLEKLKRTVPADTSSPIAAATKKRIPRDEAPLVESDRGNGYSSNPHGPLKPGDFGVHSHPDTAKLMRHRPRSI
jgi:hypothetical protein